VGLGEFGRPATVYIAGGEITVSTENSMEPITIPFQTKRSLRGILAQHAMAGIALLSAAVTMVTEQGNPHPWLMIVEAGLGVGLIIVIILEYIRIHRGRHFPFPLVDLLAGLVLGMESLNRFLEGHVGMAGALLFVALLTITVGFFRPRFLSFRSRVLPKSRIILNSAGIDVRMSPWSRFRLAWDAVAAVEYSPAAIRIILEHGHPRSIDLGSIMHSEEVVAQFSAAVDRLNLPAEKFRGFPS
jgi:hypothetical protein